MKRDAIVPAAGEPTDAYDAQVTRIVTEYGVRATPVELRDLVELATDLAVGDCLSVLPPGTARPEHAAHLTSLDVVALSRARRPLCKSCLDWSVRRSHLAGSLGAALLDRFFALGWASREAGTRLVVFSPKGLAAFSEIFGTPAEV